MKKQTTAITQKKIFTEIAKIVAKDHGKVGETLLNFQARGTIRYRRGDDYDQAYTNSIPWQHIAMVALSKVNHDTMAAIIRQALEKGKDTVKPEISALCAEMVGSTVKEVAGKTTIKDIGIDLLAVEEITD